MTIDIENFEMTLEVLGDEVEASKFFQTYENETKKDLQQMKRFINDKDWNSLKRISHTWKGRNSQIGFRRSSHIASSLHDFLQQIQEEKREYDDATNEDKDEAQAGINLCEKEDLIGKQVEIFFETLEKECEKISTFLKSQYLLE